MKQRGRFMRGSVCAFVLVCLVGIKVSAMPSEIMHIADLRFPQNPVSVIPVVEKDASNGVWREAFVFSAQNSIDGKFDLHCKYMTVEEVFRRHTDLKDYAGSVVVTGCVRAVISQTPCYLKGLILNCAREQDEDGQYRHCDMYLLKREGRIIKSLSFADEANRVRVFPFVIEESLFQHREANSKSLANVWVFKKESNGSIPKWSIIEAKIDLNSFSNLAERVLMSYESHEPRGLSM